jgi:hypothetical protein
MTMHSIGHIAMVIRIPLFSSRGEKSKDEKVKWQSFVKTFIFGGNKLLGFQFFPV